jgi:hypothetical protein
MYRCYNILQNILLNINSEGNDQNHYIPIITSQYCRNTVSCNISTTATTPRNAIPYRVTGRSVIVKRSDDLFQLSAPSVSGSIREGMRTRGIDELDSNEMKIVLSSKILKREIFRSHIFMTRPTNRIDRCIS